MLKYWGMKTFLKFAVLLLALIVGGWLSKVMLPITSPVTEWITGISCDALSWLQGIHIGNPFSGLLAVFLGVLILIATGLISFMVTISPLLVFMAALNHSFKKS